MSEEQPVGNSWGRNGQNQNEKRHTEDLGQSETANKLGQGQSETTDKLGLDQGDTLKHAVQIQSEIMEKLTEIFGGAEGQEERLLRMDFNCENMLQKQVHSQPHRLKFTGVMCRSI